MKPGEISCPQWFKY